MTAVVEFCNALLTDLAYAFTGKTHLGTNLLKTTLLTSDTEALTYDLQFTVLQDTAQHILKVRGERFVIHMLVSTCIVTRTEHISHRVVIVLSKGGVDTHVMAVSLSSLLYLSLIDLCEFCQLCDRGTALMKLLKTVDLLINLAQGSTLVQRQTHDAALLCDSLKDALANPPYGIGDKFETTSLIKFLSSLYQSDVTFVNQVGQRQSLMLILLGNRHDKAEVGSHQTLLCSLALRTALTDGLCQLDLLINSYKWLTTDLHKVLIECLT